MKRKCYALLALLLAVCMVLPMGVFVGAADETITATVKGSIVATSGEQEEDKSGQNVSACVAVEGFVDITVSYPSGYTLKAESTNNGVTHLQDNGSGKYRVIGTSTYGDGKDTITFTATKKDAADLVATVTVTVVNPVIVEMDVTFAGATNFKLDETNPCAPGDVVAVEKIDYMLSNGHQEEDASGSVEYAVNNGGFGKAPVTLKGGDTSVSIKYTEGSYVKTNTYAIVVKGKTIEKVMLSPKAEPTPYNEGATITDAEVQKNISIMVKYAGEEAVEIFGNYTLWFSHKVTGDVTGTLSIPVADRDNYLVFAVYDGVKSNEVKLSDIITVQTDTPKSFTMDVRNATKKDYIEGDTLDDFRGVTVTVSYQNSPDKTFKGDEIKALNLYIHPFVYGEKNIIVEYGNLLSKVDVSYLNIARKGVTKIRAIDTNVKKKYAVGDKLDLTGLQIELTYNDGTKENHALDSSKLTVTYSVENSDYKSASNIPSFTRAQNGYVNAKVSYGSYGTTDLQIPVTVTKRPNLKSITAVCTKVNEYGTRQGYFVGDIPSVKDFTITVYYDDNSTRTFVVEADDSSFSARTPYTYTRKSDGVTYTVKLNPTKIEEDTKKITVSYNEYVTVGTKTNKTVETDVEINVTVPDCILKHYTSARYYESTPYESIHDALDNVKEGDEIELCRDVVLTGDEPQSISFEVDLNGHTLTMIRGEIYVRSNASSSTKITFSNSSRDNAHIRYTTKEDEDVIVAYGKTYVIDRSSKNDGRYDVIITSVKNGKVTGPSEVIHGHDAKFTVTPDEGYEVATVKVNSKTYKNPTDNTLLIEDVREKLTVTVTFQEKAWQNPFTDVSKYATYYKAVQFVYEEGLFNGTSATKFEPDTTMTRAMFVTVLGRLAGVNVNNYKTSSFSDVATGQWYSEYVEWASSIGLVEGYGNGKFGPNDSITHAQMYVLMERYADIIEGKNTTASGTSISANDVRDIPDWAYEAVEYAAKSDFLVVSSYRLTPNDNAKRSELAMLLQKFCKNVLGY